jgi:hypothetical protein
MRGALLKPFWSRSAEKSNFLSPAIHLCDDRPDIRGSLRTGQLRDSGLRI